MFADVQVLDGRLGVELFFRDYATDCRLMDTPKGAVNWPVLRSTVDVFVIAHALGYWVKALLVRSSALLWLVSVTFELVERSFAVSFGTQHKLCWQRIM